MFGQLAAHQNGLFGRVFPAEIRSVFVDSAAVVRLKMDALKQETVFFLENGLERFILRVFGLQLFEKLWGINDFLTVDEVDIGAAFAAAVAGASSLVILALQRSALLELFWREERFDDFQHDVILPWLG